MHYNESKGRKDAWMNDEILESSVKVTEYTESEVSAEKQLMYKSKLPYVKIFSYLVY